MAEGTVIIKLKTTKTSTSSPASSRKGESKIKVRILPPIPPLPQSSQSQTSQQPDQTYINVDLEQRPTPVPHDPIKLPESLELISFYYPNQLYWRDLSTGYLFSMEDIEKEHYEPIGQVIETPPTPPPPTPVQSFGNLQVPLQRKVVKWFYHFEYDTY